MTARLIDPGRVARRSSSTSRELVPLDPDVCPACGARVERVYVAQGALLIHGDYGGTSTVETRFCPVCGFTRHASTTTANPRRWAA